MHDYMKIETAVGASKLEIELDEGFFGDEDYEWGSEFLHNHAMFEVHLVERGQCVMHVDKRDFAMEAPALCVIPPGLYHAQFSVRPGEVGKSCFRFFVVPAGERDRTAASRSGVDPADRLGTSLAELPFFVSTADADVFALTRMIRRELELDRRSSRTKLQSLFVALLVDITRSAPRDRAGQAEDDAAPAVERRTDRIDLYFARRYNDGPSESELAELLHISTRQLNRILKARYGVSFRHKLMETRLNHAVDLLLRSSLPVADIAARIGYESVRSFHAAFKAYTGCTPAAYRQSGEGKRPLAGEDRQKRD